MTMREDSNVKRNFLITVAIIIAVALIITFLYLRKFIPSIFLHAKEPILPVTEDIPSHKSFVHRHLKTMCFWRKRTAPPAPSSEQFLNISTIPTVNEPRPAHLSQHQNRLTHQEWLRRYHTRKDPGEEERRRKMQEEWKPRPITREYTEYWRKVAEEQKARRTLWEKMKERVGI